MTEENPWEYYSPYSQMYRDLVSAFDDAYTMPKTIIDAVVRLEKEFLGKPCTQATRDAFRCRKYQYERHLQSICAPYLEGIISLNGVIE